jgi:hypothetical protein
MVRATRYARVAANYADASQAAAFSQPHWAARYRHDIEVGGK